MMMLQTFFPDVDDATLESTLLQNGGDVDKARDALLKKGKKMNDSAK